MNGNIPSSPPPFYIRPRALQPAEHGGLSLRPDGTYRFAARSHTVPLVGTEFFLAQRDFPIVFTDEEVPLPMAVLGLKAGESLFVDAQGAWRKGAYVPAYIRRYPFIFAQSPDSTQLTLCIDEAADILETSSRRPLFQDGQPTEFMQKAMEFCVSYQRDHQATRQFAEALQKADLLVLRDARVRVSPQEMITLQGFRMVDETRFNALSAEIFLEWRKKGWVALVYAHLLSLAAWDRLALLAGAH